MQTNLNDNSNNEIKNHKFTIADYTEHTNWLNTRTETKINRVTIETTKSVQQAREGIKTNEQMTI